MEPIGIYNVLPFIVMAKADAPFKSMKDLAAFAKQAGREVILGNFGPGAVPTQTRHVVSIRRLRNMRNDRHRGNPGPSRSRPDRGGESHEQDHHDLLFEIQDPVARLGHLTRG